MYTPTQAIEAIKARLNGEWDNPQLDKLGPLLPNTLADISRIVAETNTDPVIKVVFLKEVFPDNILAVFPQDINNSNFISCYSHIRQHSTTSKEYVKELKEAAYEEYNSLQTELKSLGYSLEVLNKTGYKL